MSPACFGVACERHGQCERYHAVDGLNRLNDRIGTCYDGKAYPLFVLSQGTVLNEGEK